VNVKEQADVLGRAWEGGAFRDLYERWEFVKELRVASCTPVQLAEAVAVSNEIRERVEALLGEPLKAGICGAFAFSKTTRGLTTLIRPLEPRS
jgi:hypothetical protein